MPRLPVLPTEVCCICSIAEFLEFLPTRRSAAFAFKLGFLLQKVFKCWQVNHHMFLKSSGEQWRWIGLFHLLIMNYLLKLWMLSRMQCLKWVIVFDSACSAETVRISIPGLIIIPLVAPQFPDTVWSAFLLLQIVSEHIAFHHNWPLMDRPL